MCCGLITCLCKSLLLPAQKHSVDTTHIRSLLKSNMVETYTGEYATHFNFTSRSDKKSNYKLVANTSGYAGAYFNYKWLSFKYSWAIPGTWLDKNTKFHYTSLSFKFTEGNIQFRPFYHSYNGLLIPEKKERRRMTYTPFRDIRVSDAGSDFFYVTNSKKFSFSAASYFSERQVKSAGSLLFMATPMWQRLARQNQPQQNTTQRVNNAAPNFFLSTNKQWGSLIGRAGYTYNLTFNKGKWSIAPAFLLGGGGLKEINTSDKYLRSVYDMQAWVNAGYNGNDFYVYLSGQWGNLQTNLLIKNMHQINTDVSLTAGLRFGNLERKIMGIL